MITVQQAEAFWRVVAECLVRFHSHPPPLAQHEVAAFRAHLAEAPEGMRRGIVFHSEPFDVAARIAGSQLPLTEVAEEYEMLMEAAFPAPSVSFAVREKGPGYGADH